MLKTAFSLAVILLALSPAHVKAADAPASGEKPQKLIELRAFGVPDGAGGDADSISQLRMLDAYQERFPHIKPVSTTGLRFPGNLTMDVTPLMQIAGDIAPDVMYVNFRQSDTYIRNKFLYPLDRYIEDAAGIQIPDQHLLDLDQFIERLKKSPNYEQEFAERVPRQCWEVARRHCPYEEKCPYLPEWGRGEAGKAPADHVHVWCYPIQPVVMAMFYRRDLFHEAGLPDRVPETMEELLQFARKLTNPPDNRYGITLVLQELSWGTLSFLYSCGGRVVEQDEKGRWRCVFDTDEAVEAYYFVARMFHEPFENQYNTPDNPKWLKGVVSTEEASGGGDLKVGLEGNYLNQRFFSQRDPNVYGFGPVPKGPTGIRGSEFNSQMTGIYAGLDKDKVKRDAAWEYMRFYDGPEARRIRTTTFVEYGQGRFVRAPLLIQAGFPEYVRQVPAGWEEAFQAAMAGGVPEPYGENCQLVYKFLSKAVDTIITDDTVKAAIGSFDEQTARTRIREILKERVALSNEKMLKIIPPEQKRIRTTVASIVAGAIFVGFFFVFRSVYKTFTMANMKPVDVPRVGAGEAPTLGRGPWFPQWLPLRFLGFGKKSPNAQATALNVDPTREGHWQFSRYAMAYLILLPALGSIALWAYYPTIRGTVMAFQDYNVRGFTTWVGMDNFANVLFDDEFWYAMLVSLKYSLLFIVFGFCTPIILAFLLTEIPKGKLLFRTIYYLPAVLTGVVVIFLWKGFYGPYGMINGFLNVFVNALNTVFHAGIQPFAVDWLRDKNFALFFCLLPTIWAGMGPGCLIYLAALKTVPEDLYEAADIDGAGISGKLFNVAIPGIKSLIAINFIGVMIATIRTGGEFILAMTGGGPYTPYGQTEVVGLHIFWQAFGYLRFGAGTAMAWVLGAMLIGFTVLQLKRISRMEFRAAGAKV